MSQPTSPSLQRAAALVASIADVAPPDHPMPLLRGRSVEAYARLHQQYIGELEKARVAAQSWFDGLVDGIIKRRRRMPRGRAEDEVLADAPCAPASFAEVIAVLRRYWLLTAELNKQTAQEQRVPPEQLVLGWLIDEKPELAIFVSRLTYLPVGLDAQGQWI